jgi:methylphosphotriester-DNA--protein-cysteine methyltransferase
MYTLLGADGPPYQSETKGALGGNSRLGIYGELDCWSARAALAKGYAKIRVFFADEVTAVAAGYRPCGKCMRERYREWKAAQPAAT